MTNSTIPDPATYCTFEPIRRHKRLPPDQMRYRKKLLIERYGYQCFWCNCDLTPQTLTIDHFIPLSKGGSNKLINLRPACRPCNQGRGNSLPEAIRVSVRR
ncbi:HNH endonuclease [Nostoc sp. DSM 114161]|uniref:HNH endonuclease n=1 Tax=Nostoc sp. DSM 114161 TaxID=3440143 RepID=UPI0040464891